MQTNNQSINQSINIHYAHLDWIKGIAICLVVCGHSYVFGSNKEGGQGDFLLWRVLDAIHMPLFVLVSGYLARNVQASFKGLARFVINKAERLLLPLLFLPLLYILTFNLDFRETIASTMKGGYWFTYALFQIMLLFYLYRWLSQRLNPRGGFGLDVCLALGFMLLLSLGKGYIQGIGDGLYDRLLSLTMVNWLFKYFLLGYFIHRTPRLEDLLRNDKVSAGLVIAFVLSMLLGYKGVELPTGLLLYHQLIGLDLAFVQSLTGTLALYALALAYARQVPNRLGRMLVYLGKNSLAIYLTHYFFLPVLPMMMPFIASLPSSALAFSWELFFALATSVWVICLSLAGIYLFRLSPILAKCFYGEPIPKANKYSS